MITLPVYYLKYLGDNFLHLRLLHANFGPNTEILRTKPSDITGDHYWFLHLCPLLGSILPFGQMQNSTPSLQQKV